MAKRPEPDKSPTVSDAELALLKVLWEHGPATPAEVREHLSVHGEPRAYTTVQTLLHRLLRKGYVTRAPLDPEAAQASGGDSPAGHSQAYRASLDREDLLLEQLQVLASRVCDGHTGPLMLSLAKTRKLSERDLSHLQRIIDAPRRRRRTR